MDYLMLVDKFNAIPENYENEVKLTEIQGKQLESQACRQCGMMLKAAERDGIIIKIISAYRTRDYQQALWEQSVEEKREKGCSLSQAETEVAKTLARAGHSEHNAGLAIDFGREDSDDVEDDFFKSPQAKWLCKNAARFGFILRYPRLKEHITGISYEPWHYRYVGSEAAQFIKKSGLCLEEFLHFYSEKYI